MGEQLDERRATLMSDALDFPDELDSTEYWRKAYRKGEFSFKKTEASHCWLLAKAAVRDRFPMMHSALYLSAKRKLGELLDRESVERLPSGVHLHSTQHHDDGGHDQSQETTGIDDDVGVLGLHGVHSVCCFLLYKRKGKWYIRIKTGSFFVASDILAESLAANLEPKISSFRSCFMFNVLCLSAWCSIWQHNTVIQRVQVF